MLVYTSLFWFGTDLTVIHWQIKWSWLTSMVFLAMLADHSSNAHWGHQHHMQGTSDNGVSWRMMMQVLFLSKGILTADDALTTNQKIERVQITCSYSPLNSTHTRILGALTNLMDLKMKKKKCFCFCFKSHETTHFNTCQLSPQFRKSYWEHCLRSSQLYFALMGLTVSKVLTYSQNNMHYYTTTYNVISILLI